MHLRVKIFFFFVSFIFSFLAVAQYPQFSLSTDIGLQRSFKKEQQYWAIGHTVSGHFHFTPRDGAYFWFSYYSNGKFINNVTATAKDTATSPQQINYKNNAVMRFRHFSTGYKKYLKGAFNTESGWNLYSYAGFGLLSGTVENRHSTLIDTADYDLPVKSGKGSFKRLTLDLGLGWELPLGAGFFLYTEGRLWIPTSDYPSKYLFVHDNAPLVGQVNAGIRILFD